MKTKILLIALVVSAAIFFAGCANNNNISKITEKDIPPPPYAGTWLRQEIDTGGIKIPSPSTLVITPTGTFLSINDSGIDEGTITVKGDQMTTVVTAGLTPGQTVTHKFTVSADGQTMTFDITTPQGSMTEIYKKKKE